MAADFFEALNALEEVNKDVEGATAAPCTNQKLSAEGAPQCKRLKFDGDIGGTVICSVKAEPKFVCTNDIPTKVVAVVGSTGKPQIVARDDIPRVKVVIQPPSSEPSSSNSHNSRSTMGDPDADQLDDDQPLGYAETYSEYMPAKLPFGYRHPDPVVESASLASVDVPDVWYDLKLPKSIIEKRLLSGLQLESVVYACQRHEEILPNGQRAGFLIGDGAGVGKGRSIAGIIYENYLCGRKKAIWFSVSNDLKYDAERDLRDIGAERIRVNVLGKMKYARINSRENGKVKKGVLFSTYLSLIGERQSSSNDPCGTRLKQIVDWCGTDFDGLIIFDECHRAKNLLPTGMAKPTKSAMTVIRLQECLPLARIVYSSATGAVEPRHMAYMTRLGLWGEGTPFKTFVDFLLAVERRGVGAMELVAMDLKLRGMYLARQLSFKGVTFSIDEAKPKPEFVELYNLSVRLWSNARMQFQQALDLLNARKVVGQKVWSLFWSAHQRFFKHLCLSAKVEACATLARQALDSGKCVIIGMQSTGEARVLDAVEDAMAKNHDGIMDDFVSTAAGVFQALIEKHFPGLSYQRAADVLLRETLSSVAPQIGQSQRSTGLPEWLTRGASYKSPEYPALPEYSAFPPSTHSSEFPESLESDHDQDNEGSNPCANNFGLGDDDEDEAAPWIRRKPKAGGFASVTPLHETSFVEPSASMEMGRPDSSSPTKFVDPAAPKPSDSIAAIFGLIGDRQGRRSRRKLPQHKKRHRDLTDKLLGTSVGGAGASDDDDDKHSDVGAGENGDGGGSDYEDEDEGSSDDGESLSGDESFEAVEATASADAGEISPEVLHQLGKKRTELLRLCGELSKRLPANALDKLIDLVGGPHAVAEMTGRRGRLVSTGQGGVRYELRGADEDLPLEVLNLVEKKRFMDGEKNIAIISEAASSGISLQADRRAVNQRRRVHITLELPWSADKAVQQFGRSHRSNQTSAPEYVLLISDLAGEQRFASGVAKRLESMGALTHGDRRAAETSQDLSQFNFDNRYGRTSLEQLLKAVQLAEPIPGVPVPILPLPGFFKLSRVGLTDVGLFQPPAEGSGTEVPIEVSGNTVARFLNRILGLEVRLQNAIFSYFTDILKTVISEARKSGRFDAGIIDLGNVSGALAKVIEEKTFMSRLATTEFQERSVTLYTVRVERGISYDQALAIANEFTGPYDGFYLSYNIRTVRPMPILIGAISPVSLASSKVQDKAALYRVYRPNIGLQPKRETLADLMTRYKRVTAEEICGPWETQYAASETDCIHLYVRNHCPVAAADATRGRRACEIGVRQRTYHVLSGAVLAVWSAIETAFSKASAISGTGTQLRIVRVRLGDGRRIVGCMVPNNVVSEFIEALRSESGVELFDDDALDFL